MNARRFYVRVIGPAGRETYLADGREIANLDNATVYGVRSAIVARDDYERRVKGTYCIEIFDADDPSSAPSQDDLDEETL